MTSLGLSPQLRDFGSRADIVNSLYLQTAVLNAGSCSLHGSTIISYDIARKLRLARQSFYELTVASITLSTFRYFRGFYR